MSKINSLRNSLLKLPEKKRREIITQQLTDEEAFALLYDWDFWARPEQKLPDGDWLNWYFKAGRGSGKTRAASEAIRELVKQKARRLLFIAATPGDARDDMIEGPAGILNIYPEENRPDYIPSKRRIEWSNGSLAQIRSGANPEQIRGCEAEIVWCDELAAWKYPQESWDILQFAMRMGNPRFIITTTPKPLPVLKEIEEDSNTVVTKATTYDNQENLPVKFFQMVINKYEGTRLGQQEIHARELEQAPGALWSRADIRRKKGHFDYDRIVVAIDPAGTAKKTSNETGILVVGKIGEKCHVLEDLTGRYKPNKWGGIAVDAYNAWKADRVIGEVNNGGDMVEHVIETVDSDVPFTQVRASRGKKTRAEPVAALYEQGKVLHIGTFGTLEDQLCTWEPGDVSPDRLDALVWAITDLKDLDKSRKSQKTISGVPGT